MEFHMGQIWVDHNNHIAAGKWTEQHYTYFRDLKYNTYSNNINIQHSYKIIQ